MNATVFGLILDALGAAMIVTGGFYGDRIVSYVADISSTWEGGSPEQLAELFPEKAEAILVPEAFNQVKSAGGNADDPEYLRAVLQKAGIEAPEGASTKELQDLLATAKEPGGQAQK